MRILFIDVPGSGYGGTKRYLQDMAEYLLRQGCQVDLVLGQNRDNHQYVQKLKAAGVTMHSIDITAKDADYVVSALNQTISAVAPRIVHLNASQAGIRGVIPRVGIHEIGEPKWVCTMHLPPLGLIAADGIDGLHWWAPWRWNWRNDRINRRFLGRFDRVISVSETNARVLRRRDWFDNQRLRVIRNGVDTERYHASDGRDPSRKPLVIGGCGRPSGQKGFEDLLESFALVLERMHEPYPVLRLAGPGEMDVELVGLADRLGIREHVEFLGYVDSPEHFYRTVDIFVLPSRYEAFPFALLEAMASGLPVIATNVGDVQWILQDGKEGFVIQPRDIDRMATLIARFVASKELRESMGRSARAGAVSRFRRDIYLRETEKVYAELVT